MGEGGGGGWRASSTVSEQMNASNIPYFGGPTLRKPRVSGLGLKPVGFWGFGVLGFRV